MARNPFAYLSLLLGALILAGWATRDQGAKRPAWEYKMVSAVLNQVPFQWYEDGAKVTGQVKIIEKSNALGEQGWELVSFQNSSDSIVYWFKRLKP